MKHIFTFKSVFIALLVMICSTAKAEIVEYTVDLFTTYILNTETQEASLYEYKGGAKEFVVPEEVTYKGKIYRVTSLGEQCIYTSALVSIVIPSSVTSLGNNCFSGCFSLESIELPSSVTNLGNGCFYGCSSLKSIEIPSSVTSLGEDCFRSCSSLTSIEIPSSVTSLGNGCFRACSSLTSIEIPSSVTNLGEDCFRSCSSLTSIEIPSSVTNLGDWCFAYCSSLKTVICKMENVVDDDFFYKTSIEQATLYVPEHLLEIYKSTEPWSNFGTILPWTEELEMGVNDIPNSDLSIRSNNGNVMLSGLADGTPVSYYSTEGRMLGKTIVNNGSASFSVKPHSIVIVKDGRQSVKVHVK